MILVSDYDGTLKRQDISQKDIQAINTFRDKGHLFGIATGRTINFLTDETRLYDFTTDFIIGTNGGVAQVADETYISKISHKTICKLINFVSKYPETIVIVSDGFDYSEPLTAAEPDKFLTNSGKEKFFYNSACIKNLSSLEANIQIYKDLQDEDFPDLEFFFNNFNGGIIDVAKNGVSKSSAIYQIFVKKLNYPKSDIFTIGNSLNDLEMIQDFNGFAVSDSDPQLLEIASKTFPDVASCIVYLLSLPGTLS